MPSRSAMSRRVVIGFLSWVAVHSSTARDDAGGDDDRDHWRSARAIRRSITFGRAERGMASSDREAKQNRSCARSHHPVRVSTVWLAAGLSSHSLRPQIVRPAITATPWRRCSSLTRSCAPTTTTHRGRRPGTARPRPRRPARRRPGVRAREAHPRVHGSSPPLLAASIRDSRRRSGRPGTRARTGFPVVAARCDRDHGDTAAARPSIRRSPASPFVCNGRSRPSRRGLVRCPQTRIAARDLAERSGAGIEPTPRRATTGNRF